MLRYPVKFLVSTLIHDDDSVTDHIFVEFRRGGDQLKCHAH